MRRGRHGCSVGHARGSQDESAFQSGHSENVGEAPSEFNIGAHLAALNERNMAQRGSSLYCQSELREASVIAPLTQALAKKNRVTLKHHH